MARDSEVPSKVLTPIYVILPSLDHLQSVCALRMNPPISLLAKEEAYLIDDTKRSVANSTSTTLNIPLFPVPHVKILRMSSENRELNPMEMQLGSTVESVFTREAIAFFSETTLRRCLEILEPKAKVQATGLIQLSEFELMPEDPEIPDAIKFVESCFKVIGVGFHPDTDFAEYINVESEERLFSDIDAVGLNWQLERAMELLSEEEEDAYSISVRLAQKWYAETQPDKNPMGSVES